MAHLHAILATESPMAILIKRGPGRCSGTIGWDRRSDSFEVGQWIKQRIDYDKADLSPDGEHFVYYVNTQRWSEENSIYRAVSRPPWLKALAFWGSKPQTYGPGVGMFFRDANGTLKLRASVHHPAEWDRIGIRVVGDYPDIHPWNGMAKDAYLFIRLQRDGWIPMTAWEKCPNDEAEGVARWSGGSQHRIIFEKSLPHGWTLRQTHWCGLTKDENQATSWESFALVSPMGGVQPQSNWEWADVDTVGKRVVWTADCILFCSDVIRRGLETAKLLLNLQNTRFEARQAPY